MFKNNFLLQYKWCVMYLKKKDTRETKPVSWLIWKAFSIYQKQRSQNDTFKPTIYMHTTLIDTPFSNKLDRNAFIGFIFCVFILKLVLSFSIISYKYKCVCSTYIHRNAQRFKVEKKCLSQASPNSIWNVNQPLTDDVSTVLQLHSYT